MHEDDLTPDELGCEAVATLVDQHGEWAPVVQEHLAECDRCMDRLIADAMVRRPVPVVPEGFAARVVAALPDVPPATEMRYPGLRTSLLVLAVGALVLVLACLVDPRWLLANGRATLIAEFVGAAEVCGLGLWFGLSSGFGAERREL